MAILSVLHILAGLADKKATAAGQMYTSFLDNLTSHSYVYVFSFHPLYLSSTVFISLFCQTSDLSQNIIYLLQK